MDDKKKKQNDWFGLVGLGWVGLGFMAYQTL